METTMTTGQDVATMSGDALFHYVLDLAEGNTAMTMAVLEADTDEDVRIALNAKSVKGDAGRWAVIVDGVLIAQTHTCNVDPEMPAKSWKTFDAQTKQKGFVRVQAGQVMWAGFDVERFKPAQVLATIRVWQEQGRFVFAPDLETANQMLGENHAA